MLKLKLQYFGNLIWTADLLEKSLMLGKIEGRRRRGDRGWDGWMTSPLQWTWTWAKFGKYREAWHAVIHGITKSWTTLGDSATTTMQLRACLVDQTVKKSTCNLREPSSIPGSERSPGEGNSYPVHYSCLENFMDRESWQTTVHGVAKGWTQLRD